MSRYTGPRNKLARAIGQDLGLKTNAMKTAKRLNTPPGQHGAKNRRRGSDYGTQLKEKQKLKFIYGLTEKQLRRLYADAARSKTNTGETLLSLIELRLDNVVYRLGFAPTRASARQLVNHGHVRVSDKKVTIPSYRTRPEEIITLSKRGINIPVIEAMVKEDSVAPAWLEKKAAVGKVSRKPERQDVAEAIQEQLVVEYYSR